MGILSSLFSGLAQAVHGAAKAVDDFAEKSGAPAIFRAATGAVADATGWVADKAENMGGHEASHASPAAGTGFFAGLKESIMGGGAPDVAAAPVKLGRNAAIFNGTIAGPAVAATPFDVDMAAVLGNAPTPNVGNAGYGQAAGAGMNA